MARKSADGILPSSITALQGQGAPQPHLPILRHRRGGDQGALFLEMPSVGVHQSRSHPLPRTGRIPAGEIGRAQSDEVGDTSTLVVWAHERRSCPGGGPRVAGGREV